MRGDLKVLLASLGTLVIFTEAAACQCLAENTPATIPSIEIEYMTKRAAGSQERIQWIQSINEPKTESGLLFTASDAKALQKIAISEAGNQGPDGMWLVMSVVLNRVSDEDYPNTIQGVIKQPHQFSSVTNGSYDKVSEISDECMEAYTRLCTGDVCPEIIGFERVDSDVLDKWFTYAFTYREHKFYTRKETSGD